MIFTILTNFPENIIIVDGISWEESVSPIVYNQSSTNIHQETHFPLNLNYPPPSLSGAGKSIPIPITN